MHPFCPVCPTFDDSTSFIRTCDAYGAPKSSTATIGSKDWRFNITMHQNADVSWSCSLQTIHHTTQPAIILGALGSLAEHLAAGPLSSHRQPNGKQGQVQNSKREEKHSCHPYLLRSCKLSREFLSHDIRPPLLAISITCRQNKGHKPTEGLLWPTQPRWKLLEFLWFRALIINWSVTYGHSFCVTMEPHGLGINSRRCQTSAAFEI